MRYFDDNGKVYTRRLDGEVKQAERMPKGGLNQPVRNKPDLRKDVIYGERRNGGRTITIVVRDTAKGVEVFRESVYYNRYGIPEFSARGSFWLSPEKVMLSESVKKNFVRNRMTEMARNKKEWPELLKMGFLRKQIRRLALTGWKEKELGVVIHQGYQLGRMLLVESRIYGRFAHHGGGSGW